MSQIFPTVIDSYSYLTRMFLAQNSIVTDYKQENFFTVIGLVQRDYAVVRFLKIFLSSLSNPVKSLFRDFFKDNLKTQLWVYNICC